MIFVHGNKAVLAGVIACCTSLALVLGSIASERRMRFRLCEKETSVVAAEFENKNRMEISKNNNLDFDWGYSGSEK